MKKKSTTEFFYFCGHEQFQPEELVNHAKLAEEVGFDGVMVSEHFHPWVDGVGASGFAFSTLGAMAVQTSRVRLMTAVTTPLFRYHPAIIAQAAATVDRLSKGRFLLGVGTGENINEGPLGYKFPKYKERSERMVEALDIMTNLFSGESTTYAGKYYELHNAKLYSPPLKNKIPILMAAGGEKSASIAGEHADGVVVSVKSVEDVRSKILSQIPSSSLVVANRWSIYAQDEEEQWQAIQAWRGLRVPNRLEESNPKKLQEQADAVERSEILSSYQVVSSANEYVELYTPLVSNLHADIVGIQTTSTDQERVIRMVGEEVLPKLRAL